MPARSTGPRQLICLAIATRYVATLLERPKIVHSVQQNHEILTALRTILSATSMQDTQGRSAPKPIGELLTSIQIGRKLPYFCTQQRVKVATLHVDYHRSERTARATSTVSNTSTKAYPRPSSRLRLSHDHAEHDRPAYPPQSHAGDPDHRRGARRLDAGTLG